MNSFFGSRLTLLVCLGCSAAGAARAQNATADAQAAAVAAIQPVMMQAVAAGDFAQARTLCEKMIEWEPQSFVHPYNLACIEARAAAAALPRAVVALEKAVALGLNDPALLQNDPDLATLRSHPKFAAILAGVRRNAGESSPTASPPPAEAKMPPLAPMASSVATSSVTPRASAPANNSPVIPAKPAVTTLSASPVALAAATPPVEVKLPALAPKPGHIVGRAVTEDGRPLPEFTVAYSGFEDGKLATASFGGGLYETVNEKRESTKGRYEVKVPPGAYRASAHVTYQFRDRTYHFDLEALNPPAQHDYRGLGLDKLNQGLVRDFVLRMTAKKAGASESTETVYKHAYFGGRLEFDAGQYTGVLGGGHKRTPALRDAHPAASRVTITLVPQGALVDGTTGKTVVTTVTLGEAGSWKFSQRGIYPGVYVATAQLMTPDGKEVPLSVSLKPAHTVLKGASGYDEVVMDWQRSVEVDFLPNDLGPHPRFGVKSVRLYLGP